MPITRTPFIDDDGTGKTGTVWDNAAKQQLYDQIDAFMAGSGGLGSIGATLTPWTPIDGSGAGLTLTNGGCTSIKIGKLVFITANVTYPANANGTDAYLGGLPIASHGGFTHGFYSTYGIANSLFVSFNETRIRITNPATGVNRTNANLSGAIVVFSGFYLVAA